MSEDPQQEDLFGGKLSEAPGEEDVSIDQPPVVEVDMSHGGNGGSEAEDSGAKDDGPLKRLIDDNFIRYASYVIRDRAIPELNDGLKPVQRRILHSLSENDDGKFIKVANIVGHTMQYHPHGDASIGDALVTLANKRYLIEGQGNFGNLFTGDPAAAARYIECRLTEFARNELFNKELTKYVPSYDGRRKEPVVLPAKPPLLLLLGAEGIAVGLSTRILPHNFSEVIQSQIAILKKEPFEIFPDFQQGGLMDASEYNKGNGRIRLRARIEEKREDTLAIRSIPYGTTTDSVIASIEDAARKKKLRVQSINDFTAEHVEVEIKLVPGQKVKKAIHSLYAFSQCEVAVSSRIVVIKKNQPVEMDVDAVLRHNTKRLVRILRRELEVERDHLLQDLHDKTLVQLFVEHRIYKKIEECKTYPDVQQAVHRGINAFRDRLRKDVTAKDVEMLLSIKIKRISRYDMGKNRKEIADILSGLEKVEKHLEDLTGYAVRYLRGLLRKYGDAYPRMTERVRFENIAIKELTADEHTISYHREKGYLGSKVRGDELFQCSSLDRILIVWGDGRYKVINPPEKLFVDRDVIYCAKADRDHVFTVVYREEEGFTYLKRFSFGGAILNKEYTCTMDDAKVLLLDDGKAPALYVKYAKKKNQRIHQQVYDLTKIKVRNVKTRGLQMTAKRIASISTRKPRGWSDKKSGPPGTLLDF